MRGSAAGAAAAQGSAAGAVAARDWAARAAAGSPVEASKRVWRKPTYWPRGVRCIGGMNGANSSPAATRVTRVMRPSRWITRYSLYARVCVKAVTRPRLGKTRR